MRGEYPDRHSSHSSQEELPPRARRIRPALTAGVLGSGTTSACAENTFAAKLLKTQKWNYLRVRGEYFSIRGLEGYRGELPPRARRIPNPDALSNLLVGTTSACAENTKHPSHALVRERNYLRVRGEYQDKVSSVASSAELPPRARRIQ